MQTMRPGIYTSYTVIPRYPKKQGKAIGIAAKSGKIVQTVQKVTSLDQAKTLFGPMTSQNELLYLLQAAFWCGVPTVYAVSVIADTASEHQKAIGKLIQQKDIYLICANQKAGTTYLKNQVQQQEQAGRELLIVTAENTVDSSIQLANQLNHKRILVSYPAIVSEESSTNLSAIILASLISVSQELNNNLNGTSIEQIFQIEQTILEEDINRLLQNGVAVFEQIGGHVELIRGVTTQTIGEDGQPDYTYRDLSVVLILDIVLYELRQLLLERMKRVYNDNASLNSIASLLACKLDELEQSGYLSTYELPRIYRKSDDSTACVADVSFTIRQGISQIYLTAQITI